MLSVRLNAAAVAADDLNECQITRLIEIKVNIVVVVVVVVNAGQGHTTLRQHGTSQLGCSRHCGVSAKMLMISAAASAKNANVITENAILLLRLQFHVIHQRYVINKATTW